ncbi:MAG TPA: DUF1697 domain-containing protein [Acidimicrobiales bacterium]|nr:DUF1697 domain-containing protein [Acidimicrobiales bacterium]
MTTRVAFLRAVNVGKRTVANARVAQLLEGLGYEDVWTYVNSGNVVFTAPGRREALERAIGEALEAEYGFEVTTFVRTAAELRRLRDARPFEVGAGDTYFVTFLRAPLPAAAARALESLSNDFDTLVVAGRDVHWRMHGKSTDTTIGPRQWKEALGTSLTTSRNMTSLTKLIARLDA